MSRHQSHFFRDGQPLQEASGWDVLWGAQAEWKFITFMRLHKKTMALRMSNLHLHEEMLSVKVKRPEQIALNSWNMGHSLWRCDFEIQVSKLHFRTSLSFLGPKKFSVDLSVKQQERQDATLTNFSVLRRKTAVQGVWCQLHPQNLKWPLSLCSKSFCKHCHSSHAL